jgi:hypothetical protein
VTGGRIPAARLRHCDQCGDPVDTHDEQTRRAVRGFVRPRRAGGANAIELREDLDLWLCRHCTDRRKRGHSWTQPTLWDES